MSLSNATWQAFSRGANVQETWGLWLFDDLGNELHLSDRDGAIGTDTMHGFVEDWGDVRRSIDLTKFSAKVDNLSIKLHNGLYHGEKLIETIGPHAVRKWINREARIYSWLNGNASSKMQIYTGRLRNVSWTADSIDLDIEQAQPWDFIRIPDTLTDVEGVYAPIFVGSISSIDSTSSSPGFCRLLSPFPLPVARRENGEIICPVAEISGPPRAYVYEQNSSAMVPILDGADYAENFYLADGGGYYYCGAPWEVDHTFKIKPTYADTATTWTGDEFTDQANAYDSPVADETTTYAVGTATADFFNGTNYEGAVRMGIAIPFSTFTFSDISVAITYSATTGGTISSKGIRIRSGETSLDYAAITADGSLHTATFSLTGKTPPSECQICGEVYGSVSAWLNIRVYDVVVTISSGISAGDDDLAQANARESIEHLYFSGNGVAKSWTSGVVEEIHEFHREALYRYAGVTSTPDGWSALAIARNGWTIRWWLHEQEDLQKVLEQAQYEGAFIFIWSMTTAGTGRYLFVKNSYSAGDVAATISETDDTLGLSYKHTPFDELVTKQTINYQRHPAIDGHIYQHQATNSTARTAWNIQTLENVETTGLDMLTGIAVEVWASIRDNIFGDLKRIVSCDIVNPRHFTLEIGDVVQFDDDVRYYMITDERRTQGRLSITAREVYA